MSNWLKELREAHRGLAAEGLYTTGGGSEAWNRLSALIESGRASNALAGGPEISDEDDLSLTEQRKQVLEGLYQAAISGNVTAVLKWLDLHRGEFDLAEVTIQAVPDSRAIRIAVRSATEAHNRRDRRGVTTALREIESILDGQVQETDESGAHNATIDALEDAFKDLKEPSHLIERVGAN